VADEFADEAAARLRQAGLRVTRPRLAVTEALRSKRRMATGHETHNEG
jgi:Fe2+ or Zn2+ uptake regulation protein